MSRKDAMRAILEDFVENGLGPLPSTESLEGRSTEELREFYRRALADLDATVRERARAALTGAPSRELARQRRSEVAVGELDEGATPRSVMQQMHVALGELVQLGRSVRASRIVICQRCGDSGDLSEMVNVGRGVTAYWHKRCPGMEDVE